MASADPRDPVYGKPYVGTPVLPAARGGEEDVLDMNTETVRLINTTADDDHYTPDGDLYHE